MLYSTSAVQLRVFRDGLRKNTLVHVVQCLKGHARCIDRFRQRLGQRRRCRGGGVLLVDVPVALRSGSQTNIAVPNGGLELSRRVWAIGETVSVVNLRGNFLTRQLYARCMLDRSGSGRVQHLSTKQLWVQLVGQARTHTTRNRSWTATLSHGVCLLELIVLLVFFESTSHTGNESSGTKATIKCVSCKVHAWERLASR